MGLWDDKTYEAILADMLSRISKVYDKREGSVVYDSCAAAALEIANIYLAMTNMLNNAFADTAIREYLVRRAAERGVYPMPATSTIVSAVFNCEVPIGARFSCEEYNYTVTEEIRHDDDGYWYNMTCDMPGKGSSATTGNLTPITYVQQFRTGQIVLILFPGTDEEETEAFRQRYFLFAAADTYGGNKADYLKKLYTINGVGGGKVYCGKDWNGGGTVKLVIISSTYQVPTQALIDLVQETFDPIDPVTGAESGTGEGIAPIGHFVTVVGVDTQTANITSHISLDSGVTIEQVRPNILAAIYDYMHGLNTAWATSEHIICRTSLIESAILSVTGVIDAQDTRINGEPGNFVLDKDAIVLMGTFEAV